MSTMLSSNACDLWKDRQIVRPNVWCGRGDDQLRRWAPGLSAVDHDEVKGPASCHLPEYEVKALFSQDNE